MKNFKHVLSLLLVLCVASELLSGCGLVSSRGEIDSNDQVNVAEEVNPPKRENVQNDEADDREQSDLEADDSAPAQESLEDRAKNATETLEVWDGSIAESFDGGDGSAENPYQIANGAQLAKLASDTNSGVDFSTSHFVLTSDILLNDMLQWTDGDGEWVFDNPLDSETIYFGDAGSKGGAHPWKPIGSDYYFCGTFDGCGHTVWGLAVGDYYSMSGLFGTLKNGTVSNVTVACSWIFPVAENVGTIVGLLSSNGTINNCHMEQVVIRAVATCVGGICGSMDNSNGCSIINSSASGLIRCFLLTTKYNKYLEVGGIVGDGTAYQDSGMVNNCYNRCKIVVNTDIQEGYSDNFNLPGITVGGICGAGAQISDCHNAGNIMVVANNMLSEEYTNNPYVRIGGITGSCLESIENCSSLGEISYSGNITDVYIGGVAGLLGDTRPYGDFSGLEDVNVAFCYSDMEVISALEENIGGIAGSVCGEVNVTNSYYNKNYASTAISVTLPRVKKFGDDRSIDSRLFTDQIKGLSEEELANSENYYNWDFGSTWIMDSSINDGLPMLRSLSPCAVKYLGQDVA